MRGKAACTCLPLVWDATASNTHHEVKVRGLRWAAQEQLCASAGEASRFEHTGKIFTHNSRLRTGNGKERKVLKATTKAPETGGVCASSPKSPAPAGLAHAGFYVFQSPVGLRVQTPAGMIQAPGPYLGTPSHQLALREATLAR